LRVSSYRAHAQKKRAGPADKIRLAQGVALNYSDKKTYSEKQVFQKDAGG
jgi:hypothetical protein